MPEEGGLANFSTQMTRRFWASSRKTDFPATLLGPDVPPLILRELEREPDDWFWALNAITRQDAVKPEHAGDVEMMARDWLEGGKARGLA